jgi:hypothetical protein
MIRVVTPCMCATSARSSSRNSGQSSVPLNPRGTRSITVMRFCRG